jgi:hypothetical protein
MSFFSRGSRGSNRGNREEEEAEGLTCFGRRETQEDKVLYSF